MDLGADLRQARERAGLSHSDLSVRTRIPSKYFRAIEEHDFASVPAGIFVRSYIRSYAREVGLDPDAAVAAFRALTEPPPELPSETTDKPADDRVPDKAPPSRFDPKLLAPRSRWGTALLAVVLLIGLIGINRFGASSSAGSPPVVRSPIPPAPTGVAPRRAAQEAAPAAQPSAPELPQAAPVPPETAQAPPPAPPPAPPTEEAAQPVATTGTGGIQIDMRAEGLCWVRGIADGEEVFARLLQPGETQSITGQRDVVIRIGDPAALSYSINGKPGRPLGEAMVPVTVQFGPDGPLSITP